MRLLIASILLASLIGCKGYLPQKATKAWANTKGIGISHDPATESPPEVHSNKADEEIAIPAGSFVTIKKTEATQSAPASVETHVVLPNNQGTVISTKTEKYDLSGSKGFSPPKPPSATEKANAGWMYAGIVVSLAGIFFMTPWGGSNYRVGAMVAAGGVAMAIAGKLIDQIKLPPQATGLLFIGFALAVYYGYRVRHKQAQVEPSPSND